MSTSDGQFEGFFVFLHNSSKFSLTNLVSLKILGSPREFKIKFYEFEQCLAAHHDFVMTGAGWPVKFNGLKH